jgi:hypothetical protein
MLPTVDCLMLVHFQAFSYMIANMNHDEFVAKLKELVCFSDWHHRYYTLRARKYKRIDY